MSALFLSPHNDDETLFGAFTLLREEPHVVIAFRSSLQELRGRGITAAQRENETGRALSMLGIESWGQWTYLDSEPPPWPEIRIRLRSEYLPEFDRVYAPQPYGDGGHPQHDGLGLAALDVWGAEATTLYHTYENGRGRVEGTPVEVTDGHWIRLKLLALACYESQIVEPSTGHHFAAALHEYYA